MLWDDRFPELEDVDMYLIGFFIAFAVFYIVEFMLKFIAFGLSYFQSLRNIFDCLLSIIALIYIILAVVYLCGNMHGIIFHVADTALLLTVLKLITILMKYSTFQNLLSTVVNTLVKASSLFGVLLCIIVTYAFVGNLFFTNVRSGEAVDYGLVNFNGVFVSMNIVFRVMTGEDWHQLLTDAMVQWPYCSERHAECGSVPIAIIGFIFYYVAVTFILINVVVAVLLENFSIFYNEDDTELSHGVVKDFKQNWLYFDKKATGTIKNNKVKLFLRTLKLQEFFTYRINENGVKERTKCFALDDPLMLREIAEELRRDPRQLGGKPEQTLSQQQFSSSLETNREAHSFQDVLKAMAYRAEDITKRLVPHELYVREELEESVQFDVAENCILKWMQCFVKPVAKCQARHRRQTMSQSVLRRTPNFGLREDSVMWDASNGEWNDHYVSAPETEDDGDLVTSGQPFQQHVNLEEKLTTPALVKSYAKLEKAIPKMEGKDKWHDWFQMQADWMENVENNPDHYFDDGL